VTGLNDQDEAYAYADAVLVGERVRLRATRDADLPLLAAWMTDPAIRITQSRSMLPNSETVAREFIAGWSTNKGSDAGFSIETLADEPGLVGHIGLFGAEVKDRCGTIGIFLGRPFLGRGYGTDAVRVIVGYGFRELSLHRIQLDVSAFNPRGIAAYRKAGFVEEGRRREAVRHEGRWYDEVTMSILANEWPGATG
jgi:RimJ/RimL family protein N-acetyltransferase